MYVFIDAWLEREEPILYIRSCKDGQAILYYSGEEIEAFLEEKDLAPEDLTDCPKKTFKIQQALL